MGGAFAMAGKATPGAKAGGRVRCGTAVMGRRTGREIGSGCGWLRDAEAVDGEHSSFASQALPYKNGTFSSQIVCTVHIISSRKVERIDNRAIAKGVSTYMHTMCLIGREDMKNTKCRMEA